MHLSATTQRATAAQAITLSDGETIDMQAFDACIQQKPSGNYHNGPSAAAVWFSGQTASV